LSGIDGIRTSELPQSRIIRVGGERKGGGKVVKKGKGRNGGRSAKLLEGTNRAEGVVTAYR